MSIFSRYKRQGADGFRSLVELWESTSKDKRDRMIEVGMSEDPEYTKRAVECMYTFEDIHEFNDMELTEFLSIASPKITAYAIKTAPKEFQDKILSKALPKVREEIKTFLEDEVEIRQVGGARLKFVTYMREMEKKGLTKVKRLPS